MPTLNTLFLQPLPLLQFSGESSRCVGEVVARPHPVFCLARQVALFRMKQLPGRRRPMWLQQLISLAAIVIVTVWLVTLMRLLLVVGLIAAILLIPALKQIRLEIDQFERTQRGESAPPRDITPWHRRVWNRFHHR